MEEVLDVRTSAYQPKFWELVATVEILEADQELGAAQCTQLQTRDLELQGEKSWPDRGSQSP